MRAERGAANAVCLAVPGALETLTGGYLYDRRILEELRRLGWRTSTVSLDSSFPTPTETALKQADERFATIPTGQRVLIDGLALAGLLPLLPKIVERLDPIALIHHPLADETGIDIDSARQLEDAEKSALALVSRIVVTSPWTQRRLSDYGIDASRIAVIKPGVDSAQVTARQQSSTVRLLTVATVIPRKGHAQLIEALASMKAFDWSLRCAGSLDLDPDCANALRQQIEQAGLTDRVTLLGELSPEAVRSEYSRADLFVLPSFLEGYGMALAEAIAHGVPVVSTTVGAIPDTVPAAASRLIPAGDVGALTQVLRALMDDGSARGELTEAARQAARSVSTWRQAAEQFAVLLNTGADR